ncbi:MAG: hypothetical protein KGM24_11900 [Elusimicrobia bacterium]|nr:hypothetical protein [Elusimicrobiota bacterium]
MKTTLPPLPSLPPAPRSTPPGGKPATVPLFRFDFRREYGGIYTNRHDRFLLREEHVAELKRLSAEFNRDRVYLAPPLSMSDVVNAALDFVFEHPVALVRLNRAGEFRDALAREVYRKAFFHFAFHELLP